MKIFKSFIFLFLFALISCPVPQTRSLAPTQRFDYTHLTREMLDGTIWYGNLTTYPTSSADRFMAIRYENGKAGLARGKNKKEALNNVKKLSLHTQYQISGSKVSIPNFWDGARAGLGRVNAQVLYLNNTSAKITMYYDTRPGSSVTYEVDLASKE